MRQTAFEIGLSRHHEDDRAQLFRVSALVRAKEYLQNEWMQVEDNYGMKLFKSN